MYSILRAYTMDAITAGAREQSLFLENIRAFQPIKTTNSEARREEGWQNLYAAKLNAAIKSGNLTITFQALQGLLSGLSDILIIYFAATSVMNGDMTRRPRDPRRDREQHPRRGREQVGVSTNVGSAPLARDLPT
ncbi:hypothetical protein B4Q13_24575 [Lacticaseibacillus rhamnosus]